MGDAEIETAPQSLQALTLARPSGSFMLSLISAPDFLSSAHNALSSVLYSAAMTKYHRPIVLKTETNFA